MYLEFVLVNGISSELKVIGLINMDFEFIESLSHFNLIDEV